MTRRYSTVAVSAPDDAVLDHIAPIGLAASAGTALVVDLRADRPGYGARLTVADLVADGVRRVDLSPDRAGVAVLGSAAFDRSEVERLIRTLEQGWPAVVVRSNDPELPCAHVMVRPLYPAGPWPEPTTPAVYQPVMGRRHRIDGVVLPSLRRGQVAAMLAGRINPRWRWVRAWSQVWEASWA